MPTPSFLRPLATATAPLVVVALALVVAAAATAGSAVESSPLAIASTALLIVALLGTGTTAVAALGRLRAAGRTGGAAMVAVVGTVLVAGGQWAALFVLPALSAHDPDVLSSGALGSVTVGYVASYAVFALGWIATAVALLRSRAVPTWLGVLLIVGAIASLVPAPEALRLLIIGVAATLAGRRLTAPAPEPERVPQAA
jgi:uncharacterized membrane protein (DUF485 family)